MLWIFGKASVILHVLFSEKLNLIFSKDSWNQEVTSPLIYLLALMGPGIKSQFWQM